MTNGIANDVLQTREATVTIPPRKNARIWQYGKPHALRVPKMRADELSVNTDANTGSKHRALSVVL